MTTDTTKTPARRVRKDDPTDPADELPVGVRTAFDAAGPAVQGAVREILAKAPPLVPLRGTAAHGVTMCPKSWFRARDRGDVELVEMAGRCHVPKLELVRVVLGLVGGSVARASA